jgi:hypothetical protein
MSPTSPVSNVYYLASPTPAVQRSSRPSGGLTSQWLHLRLLIFWWRLRFTATEVLATIRRFGRAPMEIDTAFLEQPASMTLALPRPPAGPARIIDLAAARARLRA